MPQNVQQKQPGPRVLLCSPPPSYDVICPARVAVGRISFFRSPDFLPICIPNTVDHRNYRPHIPLLALVYTNTHLLGQGRLGENYSGLIYETPGRAKGRGPRLTRPRFLLSRPFIHVTCLRLSEASPRYLAKYLKTAAVFRLLSQQLWNIWHNPSEQEQSLHVPKNLSPSGSSFPLP